MTTTDQIRTALDAFWLLDHAIGEADPERVTTCMELLDDALYDLAKAAGLRHNGPLHHQPEETHR